MNPSRHTRHHNTLIVILWGLIFAKCFTLEYLVQIYAVPINSALYIWSLSLAMATAATFVFLRLKASDGNFQESLRRNRLIWGTASVAMLTTLITVFLLNTINAYSIPALFALILGASYISHGIRGKMPIYAFSGIGWWIGAAFLFAQSAVESLLLFAFLILTLSICPAVLQMRQPRQNSSQAS